MPFKIEFANIKTNSFATSNESENIKIKNNFF